MDKTPAVSAENKAMARFVASVLGPNPKVSRFQHDEIDLSVDLVRFADQPTQGVTSVATLRLSDTPLMADGHEFPTRIELVGAALSRFTDFSSVLGSAAFAIMRSGKVYPPGSTLPDYVKFYYPKTRLPHLYLTTPFLWENLTQQAFGAKKVCWLLAHPISSGEMEYLRVHGEDQFEIMLEKSDVDIFDLERKSAC